MVELLPCHLWSAAPKKWKPVLFLSERDSINPKDSTEGRNLNKMEMLIIMSKMDLNYIAKIFVRELKLVMSRVWEQVNHMGDKSNIDTVVIVEAILPHF